MTRAAWLPTRLQRLAVPGAPVQFRASLDGVYDAAWLVAWRADGPPQTRLGPGRRLAASHQRQRSEQTLVGAGPLGETLLQGDVPAGRETRCVLVFVADDAQLGDGLPLPAGSASVRAPVPDEPQRARSAGAAADGAHWEPLPAADAAAIVRLLVRCTAQALDAATVVHGTGERPGPREAPAGVGDGPHRGAAEPSSTLPAGAASPWIAPAAAEGRSPAPVYVAACLYPGGMLDATRTPVGEQGVFDGRPLGPAERGLAALVRVLDEDVDAQRLQRPRLILTGDQVYVDATAGLFDIRGSGRSVRHAWDALDEDPTRWRAAVLARASLYPLIDDHEIVDNWEPSADPAIQRGLDRQRRSGRAMFQERALHWSQAGPTGDAGACWRRAAADLFMMDSRTERACRVGAGGAPAGAARMIGPAQSRALLGWLQDCADAPSGVPHWLASAAPILPRALSTADDPLAAARSDGFDGYPATLHELLAVIADLRLRNLACVSGDAHVGMLTIVEVVDRDAPRAVGTPAPGARFVSIHAGALYAPYPFANGRPGDFAGVADDTGGGSFDTPAQWDARADRFVFRHRGLAARARDRDAIYECRALTWTAPPGSGFVRVQPLATEPDEPAALDIEFHPATAGVAVRAWRWRDGRLTPRAAPAVRTPPGADTPVPRTFAR